MKPRLSLSAKLHEPSRERSTREESWWGALSSIMCHGAQNKVCCRWMRPCCLERVRAQRAESRQEKRCRTSCRSRSLRSFFPGPFPPGQPVPLEKQPPLPGDLGPAGPPSGLSSFRSHFSPPREVGEGVTLGRARVRPKSSSVPL